MQPAGMRFWRAFLGFVAMGSLSGCVAFMPDKIHYVWDDADRPAGAGAARPDTAFVGLAFSGGGSRAAVFAAAGAEALHREGILRHVTHISSVSGGSMAASYLAAWPPEACAAEDAGCIDRYYGDYQAAMQRNYFWPMELQQVLHPNRILSPTRRVNSLRTGFDRSFLDGRSFGDLPAGRVVLINAASYDDARRFVLSNRALPQVTSSEVPLSRPVLNARSFEIGECIAPTPDDFPLSLAVAASAAFPPALGPVSIEVPPACGSESRQYWHLGDGGILENTGVETLQEVLLRETANGFRPPQALIFSFDAGKREEAEANLANPDLRLWTTNPGRVVDITNTRANAYWSIVWDEAAERLPFPVRIISIRYTDYVPVAWPTACSKGRRRGDSIAAHLAAVPTRFSITPCDAELIAASARLGVADALAAHGKEIRRLGP